MVGMGSSAIVHLLHRGRPGRPDPPDPMDLMDRPNRDHITHRDHNPHPFQSQVPMTIGSWSRTKYLDRWPTCRWSKQRRPITVMLLPWYNFWPAWATPFGGSTNCRPLLSFRSAKPRNGKRRKRPITRVMPKNLTFVQYLLRSFNLVTMMAMANTTPTSIQHIKNVVWIRWISERGFHNRCFIQEETRTSQELKSVQRVNWGVGIGHLDHLDPPPVHRVHRVHRDHRDHRGIVPHAAVK